MELAFPLLVGLVALALLFDFLNGLHDAANSIATIVATKLLRPFHAVMFAAFFNFAAYFLMLYFPSLHKVADTIGKGLIDKDLVTPAVVFGALCGAMFWKGFRHLRRTRLSAALSARAWRIRDLVQSSGPGLTRP
jgi:inorganic phosphate transporter, PiT family